MAAAINRSVETSNIKHGWVLAALETLDRLSRYLDVPLTDFFDEGARVVSPAWAATDMRLREVMRGLTDREAEVALLQIEALTLLRSDGKG
ncbi:XRE family transcriptional regulator [Azospirillum sp. 11R-A]|uniref:XRE family transcriptional regulator n=1 Tax=Azospirillum sp. 11R-A TaxID=3111634 RepID=UPI003C24359A